MRKWTKKKNSTRIKSLEVIFFFLISFEWNDWEHLREATEGQRQHKRNTKKKKRCERWANETKATKTIADSSRIKLNWRRWMKSEKKPLFSHFVVDCKRKTQMNLKWKETTTKKVNAHTIWPHQSKQKKSNIQKWECRND